MDTNVSVSCYDLNPRISCQTPILKDGLMIDKIIFDASQKKSKKEVPTNNNTKSTDGNAMTMKSLCSNSLFQESKNVDPPRQRYKRRNSAIASMLSPSVTSAAATDSSCSDLPSLRLSTALHPMDPVEALSKAKQLLTNIPDNTSPPPLKSLGASKKRASAPWSHKYYMEPSSDQDSQPRKRQRTSLE